MKLFKKLRKGFTLIELVVVIAVIAILAAVSVVSYVAITNKAKESNDHMMIDQINTSVEASSIPSRKATLHEVLEDLKEDAGFGVEKLKPELKDTQFVYSYSMNKFAYWKGSKVVYPKDVAESSSATGADLWFLVDVNSSTNLKDGHSHYLKSVDGVTELNVSAGLDVGAASVSTINYVGEEPVVIRTNSADTTLTVYAPSGSVTHYGDLGKLVLTEVDYSCYYECGKTAYAEATKGKIVAKEGGTIQVLFATAAAVAAVEDGGTIGSAYCVSDAGAEALPSGYNNFSDSKAGNVEFKYVDSNSNPITDESVAAIASASQDELKIEEIETLGLYEARIGTIGYETLSAAVLAAYPGDTVVLLKNINLGVDADCYGWSKKSFSLCLNGHTMKTISEKGVSLHNNGYTTGVFYMEEFLGSVTISGGTISSKYGTAIYIDGNSADNVAIIENVIAINEQFAEDKNGSAAYSSAVRVTSAGHVLIKSGTFTGYNAINLGSGGKADVCTIEGGVFSGLLDVGGNSQLIIKGGTFDHDPTAYVADGFRAIENGNGTWTVVAD